MESPPAPTPSAASPTSTANESSLMLDAPRPPEEHFPAPPLPSPAPLLPPAPPEHPALQLPAGWRQSVRLTRGGVEALVVTSPDSDAAYTYDAVDGGGGGAVLGAGRSLELSLVASAGSRLHYQLRCEDGLDVGVRISSTHRVDADDAAAHELQPWVRVAELEGSAEVVHDAQVVLRLDNSFSWLHAKTVHARVELVYPRPPPPPADPAAAAAEEAELRAQWLAQLEGAAARLGRRVASLRAELLAAEEELRRLHGVREAAEAAARRVTPAAEASAAAAAWRARAAAARRRAAGGARGGALARLRELRALLARVDGRAAVVGTWAEAEGALVLREVAVGGRVARDVGLLREETDVEQLLARCMRQAEAAEAEAAALDGGALSLPLASPPLGGEAVVGEAPTPADADESSGGGAAREGAEPADVADAEPSAGRSGLGQLSRLSQLLLQVDAHAIMDVERVADDAFEVRAVSIGGHVLRDFGVVSADTNIHHIVEVCTRAAHCQ
ncbi:hypothetical protein AB1Y20_019301 [Prymnesium parvum]|uniref:Uncharacterized protein n=1 Tax=Prymnesium parvum TaxID=97485 RepID=A0AB34JQZ3_PRYPA